MRRNLKVVTLTFLIWFPPGPATGKAVSEPQGLQRISKNLFQFVEGSHRNLIVLSDGDMAVVDPLFQSDAVSLAKSLKRLAPKARLKYRIYSHAHEDHVEGAALLASKFKPRPEIVATRTAATTIQEEEPEGILPPSISFSGELELVVGSLTVKLLELPPNHSPGMLVVVIESEKAVFVVDFLNSDSVGYKDLPGYDLNGLGKSINVIAKTDFNLALFGHGKPGTPKTIRRQQEYWFDVCNWVSTAIKNSTNVRLADRGPTASV